MQNLNSGMAKMSIKTQYPLFLNPVLPKTSVTDLIVIFSARGVVVNNSETWWISGGAGTSDSAIYDGNSFIPFIDLPSGDDYFHHMILLNDTHVIYLDGNAELTASTFDLTSNKWSPFTPVPHVSKLVNTINTNINSKAYVDGQG